MKDENISVIKFSWDDIDNIIDGITTILESDGLPEIIIAIARGGMIPAVILSHKTGIRNIQIFSIQETVDDTVNSQKLPPTIGENIDFKTFEGKRILIVDDIIGSGSTLKAVINVIVTYSPKEVKTMACCVNLLNWEKDNYGRCEDLVDYIGKKVEGWVVFPWENN
ncbi:MAG: hypothetical protein A2Y24_04450 [Clostridiales bacterium GWE2_32_10]|nr:MAG: hypothetical protein A2Y24_04450 [Clostridiales bacterium GWE2_32_10]HBY20911.1 hypothetical protein [Clostridiales bacterium]